MHSRLTRHLRCPLISDATVTGTDIVYLADLQPQPVEWLWQHRLDAGNSISAFVAPKTENQVPGGGLCAHPEDQHPLVNQARCSNKLLEHLDHLRETNDLFGNVPDQFRKLGKSHRIGAMATYGGASVSRDHSPRVDVADTIQAFSIKGRSLVKTRSVAFVFSWGGKQLFINAASPCLPSAK